MAAFMIYVYLCKRWMLPLYFFYLILSNLHKGTCNNYNPLIITIKYNLQTFIANYSDHDTILLIAFRRRI